MKNVTHSLNVTLEGPCMYIIYMYALVQLPCLDITLYFIVQKDGEMYIYVKILCHIHKTLQLHTNTIVCTHIYIA